MNYNETLEYIHCGFFGGTRPGLERVAELLGKLGNPQDKLRFIHVTGTNGKGSFCAMTDSVLRAAGYHTGLYTSPYIKKFNERMMADGTPISDDELAEIATFVRPFAESMEDKPTEFELITAVAMLFFVRHKCDPVVLEVGMGGRLDATNIIRTPVLSVVTGIALDHMKILGDTLGKIAAEKAGIFKKGVPVLWCGDSEEADAVIREKAAEKGCGLYTPDRDPARQGLRVREYSLDGTVFDAEGFTGVKIPLLGSYQPRNAQNALCGVTLLRYLGWNIPDEAVYRGLAAVQWPARFEIICREPLIIEDGGHNPEGIEAAVSSIRMYFPESVNILTGVLADKNYDMMAGMIAGVARKVFCLTPDNTRALSAEKYAEVYRGLGIEAEAYPDIPSAVAAAYAAGKRDNVPTVCLGSLYMYGDVTRALEAVKN